MKAYYENYFRQMKHLIRTGLFEVRNGRLLAHAFGQAQGHDRDTCRMSISLGLTPDTPFRRFLNPSFLPKTFKNLFSLIRLKPHMKDSHHLDAQSVHNSGSGSVRITGWSPWTRPLRRSGRGWTRRWNWSGILLD